MRIAIAREIRPAEHRVALVPETVARLVEQGFDLRIEQGAGSSAGYPDADYVEAGAAIIGDARALWGETDVLLKVAPPAQRDGAHEIEWLPRHAMLIGFLNPLGDIQRVRRLAARYITAISMELIPRLSRAQGMDALSSQATVTGYKGALLAADAVGIFFPMLTTAAGVIPPARVFVLGAGVAGLMAIATARRLGAIVTAFDIRPAVREEIESLGATFVGEEISEGDGRAGGYAEEVSTSTKAREQALLYEHVRQADAVITTAQVPGRRAPILITEEMVSAMRPGSVVIDLAAAQGGNCACTVPGQDVLRQGVQILGPLNVPALMPRPASQMYAKNLFALLNHLIVEGHAELDFSDDIIAAACVTHAGHIRLDGVRSLATQEDSEQRLQEHCNG